MEERGNGGNGGGQVSQVLLGKSNLPIMGDLKYYFNFIKV